MASPAPTQPNLTQLSLRGLLTMVALAAALSATLSAWLRTLDADSQTRFATRSILFIAGVSIGLLLRSIARWHHSSSDGKCRWAFYLPLSGTHWFFSAVAAAYVAAGFVLVTYAFLNFVGKLDWYGYVLPTMCGLNATPGVAWLWRNGMTKRIEFREGGVVTGNGHLRPWKLFKTYSWSPDRDRLTLLSQFASWGTLTIPVPPADYDVVDQIVSEFLKPSEWVKPISNTAAENDPSTPRHPSAPATAHELDQPPKRHQITPI